MKEVEKTMELNNRFLYSVSGAISILNSYHLEVNSLNYDVSLGDILIEVLGDIDEATISELEYSIESLPKVSALSILKKGTPRNRYYNINIIL